MWHPFRKTNHSSHWRGCHFKTRKLSWNEQKFGRGSWNHEWTCWWRPAATSPTRSKDFQPDKGNCIVCWNKPSSLLHTLFLWTETTYYIPARENYGQELQLIILSPKQQLLRGNSPSLTNKTVTQQRSHYLCTTFLSQQCHSMSKENVCVQVAHEAVNSHSAYHEILLLVNPKVDHS